MLPFWSDVCLLGYSVVDRVHLPDDRHYDVPVPQPRQQVSKHEQVHRLGCVSNCSLRNAYALLSDQSTGFCICMPSFPGTIPKVVSTLMDSFPGIS